MLIHSIIPQSQPEHLWLELAPTGAISRKFLKKLYFWLFPKAESRVGGVGSGAHLPIPHARCCTRLIPASQMAPEQDLSMPVPLSCSVYSILHLWDEHDSLFSPSTSCLSPLGEENCSHLFCPDTRSLQTPLEVWDREPGFLQVSGGLWGVLQPPWVGAHLWAPFRLWGQSLAMWHFVPVALAEPPATKSTGAPG